MGLAAFAGGAGASGLGSGPGPGGLSLCGIVGVVALALVDVEPELVALGRRGWAAMV